MKQQYDNKPAGRSPEALLPLSTPVFHVLLSLTEHELHGYGIIQDIERRTDGEVTLSTSTLYGAIKRMMRDGLIERSAERPDPEIDDERRRYYRITAFGKDVARLEALRIERLAQTVKKSQLLTRAP
ncbi:MAG: helix-turn-helix transcriptional regulator [Gemmatimonadota bacterium]|nr:MAG: helix-turn-helix transcriptional regulator [Gemmatimonadota bacterium]